MENLMTINLWYECDKCFGVGQRVGEKIKWHRDAWRDYVECPYCSATRYRLKSYAVNPEDQDAILKIVKASKEES